MPHAAWYCRLCSYKCSAGVARSNLWAPHRLHAPRRHGGDFHVNAVAKSKDRAILREMPRCQEEPTSRLVKSPVTSHWPCNFDDPSIIQAKRQQRLPAAEYIQRWPTLWLGGFAGDISAERRSPEAAGEDAPGARSSSCRER